MSWKSVFAFLVVVVFLPATGKAEVNRSWESLAESAQVGKSVVVIRMTAGQVEGKLLSINSDAITVEQHGVREVIQRGDVFRVRYANIRRRNTLLGLAIGVGAGIALGASADSYKEGAALGGALFGAGIGSVAGAVVPIGTPLYEAESVRRPSNR